MVDLFSALDITEKTTFVGIFDNVCAQNLVLSQNDPGLVGLEMSLCQATKLRAILK